jgi:hypothetical protein
MAKTTMSWSVKSTVSILASIYCGDPYSDYVF